MSLISIKFILFLVVIAGIYFITPKKYQWITLLVGSYAFYMFAGVKLVIFLLITTTSTFCAGLRMGKVNEAYDAEITKGKGILSRADKKNLKLVYNKRKRKWLIGILLLNFGILFVLKYTNILVGIINFWGKILGAEKIWEIPSFILPLGISFYTFQSMGYLIDVYRNKYKPETNWARFALFVSFFPQLIQGPIGRFDHLAQQLYEPHAFDYQRIKHGIELMLWGYFKKLVISDRIAIMTGTIFGNPDRYQGFYLVFGTIFSLFELYTDFSGGIDIIRGVAEVFGIEMAENFNRPFFATSLADYWRRWHMSLNEWWRDYIFYPMTLSKAFTTLGKKARVSLGDNLGKKLPIFLALFLVRIINGIWHGGSWFYFIGGLYHGTLISLAFVFEEQIKGLTNKLKINTECISWRIFQSLRTFALICVLRVAYTCNTVSEMAVYYKSLFAKFNPWILFDESLYQLGVSRRQFMIVCIALLVLLIVSIIQECGYNVREKLDEQNLVFRWLIYLMGIFAIVLFGVYGIGYDAASFLYMNF